jgi:hypothetical protein
VTLAFQGNIKPKPKLNKAYFWWINRLKNEFELSDLEVVLRTLARGISIKYTGIHDL